MGDRQSHLLLLGREQRTGPVSGFSFDKVAPLELFERLVLRAYSAFGCFPDPHYEPILPAYCDGPEDFAMDTITKFLDPDNDTVRWNAARGAPTIDGLLAYLERVMINDFLDRKRSKRFLLHAILPPMESDDGIGITLDELAKHVDTPEAIAQRRERHEQLIASFSNTPDLQDVLRLQLDPDAYAAYTNIDLASLLNTTVSDIENRKKRIHSRLLKRLHQQRVVTTQNSLWRRSTANSSLTASTSTWRA
jgi:DNA-directed RNA polymerase specialized sigma24 family protein